MGFRFKKSIKVLPGVKVNVGKKSVGISVGNKFGGVSVNSASGVTKRVSLPGSGISYTERTPTKKKAKGMKPQEITTQVNQALKILNDCANQVNTTVKADVFFGRLNYLFDTFLFLQQFEGSCSFGNSTPTENYAHVHGDLDAIVNAFLDRSYQDAIEKASALKTEKGRTNSMIRYIDAIAEGFRNANTFWTGNEQYPHYTDALFTEDNLSKVEQLQDSIHRGETEFQIDSSRGL